MPPSHLTEQDKAEIAELLRKGVHQDKIIKQYKTSGTLIRRIMREFKIPGKKEIARQRKLKVVEMIQQGIPIEQIIEKTGYAKNTIKTIKAKNISSGNGVKSKCPYCERIHYVYGIEYTGRGLFRKFCDQCGVKEISGNV